MQETGVQSLGQKDPLEKKMATHSSITASKIPWTEEPGRLQSMESQRVRHNSVTPRLHTVNSKIWICNSFNLVKKNNAKYVGGKERRKRTQKIGDDLEQFRRPIIYIFS